MTVLVSKNTRSEHMQLFCCYEVPAQRNDPYRFRPFPRLGGSQRNVTSSRIQVTIQNHLTRKPNHAAIERKGNRFSSRSRSKESAPFSGVKCSIEFFDHTPTSVLTQPIPPCFQGQRARSSFLTERAHEIGSQRPKSTARSSDRLSRSRSPGKVLRRMAWFRTVDSNRLRT